MSHDEWVVLLHSQIQDFENQTALLNRCLQTASVQTKPGVKASRLAYRITQLQRELASVIVHRDRSNETLDRTRAVLRGREAVNSQLEQKISHFRNKVTHLKTQAQTRQEDFDRDLAKLNLQLDEERDRCLDREIDTVKELRDQAKLNQVTAERDRLLAAVSTTKSQALATIRLRVFPDAGSPQARGTTVSMQSKEEPTGNSSFPD